MDINKIPPHILDNVREKICDDPDKADKIIRHLTPKEVFEHYCDWNGMRGWSDTLWDVVRILDTTVWEVNDERQLFRTLEDAKARVREILQRPVTWRTRTLQDGRHRLDADSKCHWIVERHITTRE
jgi:hypothetical protein